MGQGGVGWDGMGWGEELHPEMRLCFLPKPPHDLRGGSARL